VKARSKNTPRNTSDAAKALAAKLAQVPDRARARLWSAVGVTPPLRPTYRRAATLRAGALRFTYWTRAVGG
jgi:hypothetical protein